MKLPTVYLNRWETGEAIRDAYYRTNRWVGDHQLWTDTLDNVNVQGALGEAAAAKYFGLRWVRKQDWEAGDSDLEHNIEIKTTIYDNLIMQGNNKLDRRYVLVQKQKGRGFHYTIMGWATGHEIVESGTYYAPGSERGGKYGSYWLPSAMLHHPADLKAQIVLEQI